MTPDEAVRAVADRLRAVDWTHHGYRSWSQATLLEEYFRRMALWTAAYGCATHTPFYDLAQCIDPAVRADQVVVDEVMQAIEAADAGWDVEDVTPFILHWAALRATPEADLPEGLEDPFEPLLLLFERDGAFHSAKGFVNFENLSVVMLKWRARASRPPLADLIPGALDEIDRAGSLRQFGYVMSRER
ncbi:hypothetical protein [Actinoplanes sp. DH11]|uniref:hypothetical protein n=1 Tax=Actinoplanes sp. DH11 TaxID=2857011 RepID=UPI001E2A3F82|nr:hypothetical protein [Actinoplanes sp. DH11]